LPRARGADSSDSRAHGLYDDRAITANAVTFTSDVAAALDAFLDRLAPIGEVSARAVLTALAFAEAPGFTPELWRLAVHALHGVQVSVAQLKQFAARSAANFLVESSGGDGSYRLFHQALTAVFVEYGAQTGWREAPGYLFRSLPGHATRACAGSYPLPPTRGPSVVLTRHACCV